MKSYEFLNEKKRLIEATATSLNEHITEVFENGYSQGNADGYERGLDDNAFSEEDCKELLRKTGWLQKIENEMYEMGLNDAWECAKKISSNPDYTMFGLKHGESYASPLNSAETITARECMDIIDRTKKDKKIKVGDIVMVAMNEGEETGVVLKITEGSSYPYNVMFADGETMDTVFVINTGRHIDLSEIFKQIHEVEEGR